MKKYLVLILLLFLFSVNIFTKEVEKSCNLEVVIDDIETEGGKIRVHLYNESVKSNFPDVSDKAYMLEIGKVAKGRCVVEFKNIPYGKYALTVHHDENNNIKMDKNFFGFPAEGWGLSGNMIPVFSLPDFEDCMFDVFNPKVKISIICRD